MGGARFFSSVGCVYYGCVEGTSRRDYAPDGWKVVGVYIWKLFVGV